MWWSIADSVVVRMVFFASVIVICSVFSHGFSECSVPFVLLFLLTWIFSRVTVVTLTGGRCMESRLVSNFANYSFEWVVFVVVVIFSRVSDISDTLCFQCVCVISWLHNRVDPEACAMVFQHIFAPRHQHVQVCLDFECGRGSLQGWADVDSMMVLICCVWHLMWSFIQHRGTYVQL